MDRETRVRLIEKHPGVRVLKQRTPCTALTKWLRPCRNWSRWHFTPAKDSKFSQAGDYCLLHLTKQGIYGDPAEDIRTERFVKRLKANGEWPE